VTVSARSANDLPHAAKIRQVSVRGATDVRAGTYPYEGAGVVDSGWHALGLHQLEYAFQGVVEVETAAAHYLLPPQQAVWIPAGLPHRTTLRRVRTMAVFFDPSMLPTGSADGAEAVGDGAADRARVLAAAPVIREMILYGARWPIHRSASDPTADAFFDALAHLVVEWLDHETPLCLPTSTDPVVAAVMAYTTTHLAGISAADVGRAVGLSERSLRRLFPAVTGMTWRRYLLESRLLRAMALLAEPAPSVLDVATQVGFDSASAFTRAFARYTGETPSAYRARVAAS
jgi:AraC-like DNA-binding protein